MKQSSKPARKPARTVSKKPVKKAFKKISALDWYVIQAVRKVRVERGLSQFDLSFKLNFSDSFVAQMESEQTPAHYNIAHLNKLARVLKCSIHEFFPKHALPEEAED